MIILALHTGNEQSELYLYNDKDELQSVTWLAHRQLADTIHTQIEQLLSAQSLNWNSIEGLAVFRGPGSFTGLRIGMTVANALALGLNVPIVAKSGDTWLTDALQALLNDENEKIVTPEYGGEANITLPKK
ncbi:MAG: tRNA (adenosine(37)-N6)-threonylcarbamoyltransferase complex dimerization subunit type 1 TsaB [Candidatus Saccharimonadales bacterium]